MWKNQSLYVGGNPPVDDQALGSALQPDSPSAAFADGAFIDQFHAGRFKRSDDFDQGIDVTANDAFASLHSLNRRQR